MADHTPGPWRVNAWQLEADGCTIADLYSWSDDTLIDCRAEAEANARLIALAPDMYEYIAACASNGCAEAKRLIAKAQGGRNG